MALSRRLKRMKKLKVAQHRADVNIGKNGLHPGIIEEIRRRLDQEGVVKIRILKNARNKVDDHQIRELAQKLNAIILDERGFTFILAKRYLNSSKASRSS